MNKNNMLKTMSSRDMFAAVCYAQNKGNMDNVNVMFHKCDKKSEMFDGDFEIDNKKSHIKICFMPKIPVHNREYEITYKLNSDDDFTGHCMQMTIDGVMNIIRDFVLKDFYVIVGDTKFKYEKIFDGSYNVHATIPFIADEKENYKNER